MFPIHLKDSVVLRNGALHTCFQATGLTKTATILPNPAGGGKFSTVAEEQSGRFAISFSKAGCAGTEPIESFSCEAHASRALSRIMKTVASDPELRWRAARRYGLLAIFAVFMLAGASHLAGSQQPSPGAGAAWLPPQPQTAPEFLAAAPQVLPGAAATSPSDASPPIKRAIVYGKPEPSDMSKVLYVFSDPQCPYCGEYEKTLERLPKDYTVFLFPTPFKPGSEEIVARVMCSPNPQKAWREAVGGKTVAGGAKCAKAGYGRENVAFFRSIGLTATPATVFGNGVVKLGGIEMPELLALSSKK